MIRRFSLYGFLKNQRYFEPFLILVFLERGLSFLMIGLLVAFRELCISVFEVPSGAAADLYGRRRVMMLSFAAYVVSFVIFGVASSFWLLLVAMFLFAIGEAFRTGTHKAMIFAWLRMEGRLDERTRVYGYTRSWSKFGSAFSVVLAALLVFLTDDYSTAFYVSVIPYLAGLVNFLGYPGALDCRIAESLSLRRVLKHLGETLSQTVQTPMLRRLVCESMGFEGVFKAAKDYLQPVLQAAALLVTVQLLSVDGSDARRAALLVGPVYFVLHLLSGVASRNAYRVSECCGSEERAARWLWGTSSLLFALMLPAMFFSVHLGVIVIYVALHVLANLWRPVLISRFDVHGSEESGATLLSLENQAKSLSTMAVAPLLGLAVDLVQRQGLGGQFWPVALVGAMIGLAFFATSSR